MEYPFIVDWANSHWVGRKVELSIGVCSTQVMNTRERLTEHLRGGDIQLISDDPGECADEQDEDVDVAIKECVGSDQEDALCSDLVPHCKSNGDLQADSQRSSSHAWWTGATDPKYPLARLQGMVDSERIQEIRNDGKHPIPVAVS